MIDQIVEQIRDTSEDDTERFSQLREMCAALDIKPSDLIAAGLRPRCMYFLIGGIWAPIAQDRF